VTRTSADTFRRYIMIATTRTYNGTYFTGTKDASEPVAVANTWAELIQAGWGSTPQEIVHNWYETHSERLSEVASLEELS
jgi:hypothetical protein